MGDFAEIAASVKELKDVVTDKLKSETEKREEFERRMADIMAEKREADKAKKAKTLTDDAPLDESDERIVSQKGGLFGGSMKLPLKKALALSTKNTVVTASGSAQQLSEIQNLHDAVVLKFLHWKNKDDATTARDRLTGDVDFKAYNAALQRAGYIKATDTILNPLTGTGTNLDFTLLSAQMLDLVRIEYVLASQFRQVPLTRPNQSFPALRSDSMGVYADGDVGPPAQDDLSTLIPAPAHFSNPTFGQVTFAARHCMGFMQFNDDMVEDSIVPWLPMMRQQSAQSIARAIDRSILDGDETGTHMDSDVTAATDFRKAWYGLRYMTNNSNRRTSLDAIDGGDAALTPTMLRSLRQKLGKYGLNASQCMYIMGVNSYYQVIKHADLATWANHGELETARTGVVDRYFGCDIVLSEFVRTDLNNTGYKDGITEDSSYALCVNRDRFMLGQYGQVGIESTRWAPLLYTIAQADVRVDFQPVEALSSNTFAAGEAPAAMIYELDNDDDV